MSTFPDQVVEALARRAHFTFNETEGANDVQVETNLDEQGLHVYGSAEAFVEFLLTLGYAVGYQDPSGEQLKALVDLTEGVKLNPSGADDVDVQLPKFLTSERYHARA